MPAELKVLEFPTKAAPKKKKRKKLRKYERADGRFCKYVTVNGIKKAIYGTSTEDVIEQAKEYKMLVTNGLTNLDYEIRVKDWCDLWFKARRATKGKGYQRNADLQMRLIVAQIGHMRVRDVREIHLQNVLNSRSGMSKSQIEQLSNTIKSIFSFARKNRLITIDPSMDIIRPIGTYEGHRILEKWEIDFLLANVTIHRSMIWALTMLFAGLRRGELLALETKNIDFEARRIHIVTAVRFEDGKAVNAGTTKTKAGIRDVPIYEPLYSILKRDLSENPRQYLASQECGKPILSEGGFRGQWDTLMRRLTNVNSGYPAHLHVKRTPEQKAAFEATLKYISFTPHDLRYTFATMLFNAGVDEKSACKIMGHRDVRMTRDLYAKLTIEQNLKSDKKMEEYLQSYVVTEDLTNNSDRRSGILV
ncbi:MAG: site-specific integrase [Clostridia bacterium]|nr:site-specific integrase [Clostridia bacterium]